MSGKGSAPRPLSVSNEEYANRWDSIFSKDKPKEEAWEQLELPLEHSVSANSECTHPVWGYEYTEEMYFCVTCGVKSKHPAKR